MYVYQRVRMPIRLLVHVPANRLGRLYIVSTGLMNGYFLPGAIGISMYVCVPTRMSAYLAVGLLTRLAVCM